jgi:hypothetical protein
MTRLPQIEGCWLVVRLPCGCNTCCALKDGEDLPALWELEFLHGECSGTATECCPYCGVSDTPDE